VGSLAYCGPKRTGVFSVTGTDGNLLSKVHLLEVLVGNRLAEIL
jgi:hypothetical protein